MGLLRKEPWDLSFCIPLLKQIDTSSTLPEEWLPSNAHGSLPPREVIEETLSGPINSHVPRDKACRQLRGVVLAESVL